MDLAITCIKLNVVLISRLRLDAQLVAFSMHQTKALVSMETASWYNKKGELTFSDIIAIVRRSIWSNKYFSKSENQLDLDKCSEEKINALIYQLTLAA